MPSIIGPLVAPARDDGPDAAPGEQAPHRRIAVSLVPDELARSGPRPPTTGAADLPAGEELRDVARLVTLTA